MCCARFAMLWVIGGILVLLAAIVDLFWTTLGTHGGGRISAPITRVLWAAVRKIHQRRPFHRVLSFVGSILLFGLVLFWVLLVWLGWTLVFTGSPTAVIVEKTGEPVDVWTRIYFVASLMFTPGSSQYVPNGSVWKIAASLAAGSGLVVVTLSITYILSVLSAIIEKRTLASAVWDIGGTPERIIDRSWTGEKFEDIQQHMIEIITGLELLAENHLAYPIIEYFHGENRRVAAPLRIAALYDTLLLLREGVDASVRPPKLVLYSTCDAIENLTDVLLGEFISPAKEPPPRPDFEILRSRAVPVRDEKEYIAAVESYNEVRRRLLGMIHDSGWTWEDVFNMKSEP